MPIRKHLASSWRGPSVYDDAIDWSETPRAEYISSRDPALVKCHPGEEATLWTLRDLRQTEVAYLRDFAERGESATCYQRAFQLALEDCSDTEIQFQRHDRGRSITDESFESIPQGVWLELGALAYQRAGLTPGEAPRFAQPRGLPPIPKRRVDSTARSANDNESSPRSESD